MKKAGIGIAAIGAIATVAAVAIFKFTSSFAKQGDQLAKTSKQIGVGVIQLQKWQFAVERSGGDGEKFVKGLVKMRIELERVALGETAESASAFDRLGISIDELTTGSIPTLEELLPRIADGIANLTTKQEQASVAALIFGTKVGKELVPFLQEGAEGIKRLGEEAEGFGLISEETAKKAEDFVDAQRNLKQATTSLKSVIASELMPQLTVYINALATWISKNDELIGQKVSKVLQGVIDVLPALITLVQGAAKGFLLLAQGIEKVASAGAFIGDTIAGSTSKERQKLLTELQEYNDSLDNILASQEEQIPITEALDLVWIDLNKTIGKSKDNLDDYIPAVKGGKSALEEFEEAQKAFSETLEEQIESLKDEIILFNASTAEIIKYNAVKERAAALAAGFSVELINEAEQLRLTLDKLEEFQELFEFLSASEFDFFFGRAIASEVDEAEDELDSLGVFAAAVAANINTAFADTLTELVFDFENFGDAIKDVLRSILNAFFQMITTIATNPIRIGIEQSLDGSGGSIIGGLGDSFSALGSLVGIGAGIEAGFLGTLGAAIPAIGAIVAVLAIAIPLISKLFETKPRLDVDIGFIRDEMGKRAALVSEFLDPALIDDIINISVKRKAGLGVGGNDAIKNLISDSIVGSIEAIQSIIGQLPQDIFEALNEMLLNAEVDMLSLIKGDKLLEFDESKKIAERFQQFIEGDLPARLFASLRDSFFGPMLISLGVASEAVQGMMDDFLASLQGATREERIILGQEFLATIDAYVDVFNLLNEGMKGVMAQAISDVTALAARLDIKAASGIPTLREIEAALEDLFETGMLTAETAQNFLLLRQAVIDLTLGLSRSVSNITAIISQLDADIVGLGGSAIGTSAGIEEAIDTLQNLLDNEALSLDEREAILNELNSLADQLASTELANAQQGIQSSIDAANSHIQNLQRLKTVRAEGYQAELDALNKKLNLAEELESLLEGIRRNIGALLLAPGGPESVFERIARARGDVASLFGELASASPEAQAGIASQIQDLLNELDQLRQEAFQSPSAESDDLFREVIGNLEKLEGLIEPARSSEEIQASIETIEAASQAFLSSIDSQIASLQSNLTTLQTTGNQLTGEVADRVRELKEAIRAEFVEILAERLEQLGEVSGTGFEAMVAIEEEALIVFREQADTLQVIAANTAQLASQSATVPQTGFGLPIPGFAHGGFVPPGVEMLAMLHGGSKGEDVIPRDGNSGQGADVHLHLPPLTFSPNQVVNPDMFMKELFKSLHNPIVTREIEKIRGRK